MAWHCKPAIKTFYTYLLKQNIQYLSPNYINNINKIIIVIKKLKLKVNIKKIKNIIRIEIFTL